jgi:malic enzyme
MDYGTDTRMLADEAREYHSSGRPGKIEIAITKPCATQHDLALAYTPGVAVPVHTEPRQNTIRSVPATRRRASTRSRRPGATNAQSGALAGP